MGLILSPGAKREYHNAIAWYEDDYPGRGRRFFEAVEGVFKRIRQEPLAFQQWGRRSELRFVVVPHFPYRVIFCEEPNGIVVYAVAHTKLRAGYWRKRVPAR
jgi:plasmid stabilization system protein ParE